MINFEELATTILCNFQGGDGEIEVKVYADKLNRIVKSIYPPGTSTGYHQHDMSSEIIFILSGRCRVLHDGEEESLTVGHCHYCKRGQSHAVINDGDEDLIMYSVVCNQ